MLLSIRQFGNVQYLHVRGLCHGFEQAKKESSTKVEGYFPTYKISLLIFVKATFDFDTFYKMFHKAVWCQMYCA